MELIAALFIFAFSTTITPGPNNVMIMASGMNYGVRASMPHYLGICFGFPLMVLCVGLGLGAVFDIFPALHHIIKIIGVVYLLYLAWHIAMAAPSDLESDKSKPFTFLQSTLFQWVNPKAWIMATGAVAAYTTSDGNIFVQICLVAFAFLVAGGPCVGVWLLFGSHLKKILTKPAHQQKFNWAMALILVVSVLPVIYEMVI